MQPLQTGIEINALKGQSECLDASAETSAYKAFTVNYQADGSITGRSKIWLQPESRRDLYICSGIGTSQTGQTGIAWWPTMFTTTRDQKIRSLTCESKGPQKTSVWSRRGTTNHEPNTFFGNGGRTKGQNVFWRGHGRGFTHRLTLPEFLLSTVEVKVHVQALHKLGDWILVGIRFLEKNELEYNENQSTCYNTSIRWLGRLA